MSRASNCSIRFSAAVVLPLPDPPRKAACWTNSFGSKVTGAGVTLMVRPRTSGPALAAEGQTAFAAERGQERRQTAW